MRAPILLGVFAFALLLPSGPASAEVSPRKIVDVTGDFVIIGNTLGHTCEASAPRVGTVSSCTQQVQDSSPDLFWRSETSSAAANPTVTAERARSTAVLSLPANAEVLHAYLYWFGCVFDPPADGDAVIERPGGASFTATATRSFGYVQLTPAARQLAYQETFNYLSVADITAFVQAQGSGSYRVSGVASHPLDDAANIAHVGWVVVVIYARAGDPPRNVALFEGLDRVTGSTIGVSLSGFRVPDSGFDGKLAIVGIDGEVAGAQLRFGVGRLTASDALSDALNPANRFFNGTRSFLGAAVSVDGDLPRSTGLAGSLSAIDIDVVDITGRLTAGQIGANAEVAAGPNDGIQTFVWATSITTLKPDFSGATKTASPAASAALREGSELLYAIAIPNRGNDASTDTVLRDPLPTGLEYVPGSLEVLDAAGRRALTDDPADDAGEYDGAARTLVVRLGQGADAQTGGSIAPGADAIVFFRATLASGTAGMKVENQARVEANGAAGAPRFVTLSDGDALQPGAQTSAVDVTPEAADGGAPDASAADAGGPLADASAVAPDGGATADAGLAADSGTDDDDDDDDDGCGCRSTHAGSGSAQGLGLLFFAALGALVRSRRGRGSR